METRPQALKACTVTTRPGKIPSKTRESWPSCYTNVFVTSATENAMVLLARRVTLFLPFGALFIKMERGLLSYMESETLHLPL